MNAASADQPTAHRSGQQDQPRAAVPNPYRITLHGLTAEVTAPRRTFDRTLGLMLSGYPAADPSAPADLSIRVERDSKTRQWIVSSRERSYTETTDHTMAARRVEWLIISDAVRLWERFIHVHAAVLATPAASMVLVGRSGAGKSTTSVALAQAGLTLYTDDVALIDRATMRPVSVPRPIKLDERSRRLLRKTGLVVRPSDRLGESISRMTLPGMAAPDCPGPPLAGLVFFGDVRGATASLREITRAEAMMRLVLQSATERFDRAGPSDGALDIVNAVKTYEVTAGDLASTVRVLLDLIDPHRRVSDHRILDWPHRPSALSAD